MPRRRKKTLNNKLQLVIFVLLLIGIFAGGAAAGNSIVRWLLPSPSASEISDELPKLPGINVLVLGLDERDEAKSFCTDTIILANINNKNNRISFLSIPRDTKVSFPGHGGINKINAANFYGGPELAMETVSELIGIPVDYYIVTNFGGFKGIVDALGGVTIDVEEPMKYDEKAYGGAYSINLQKGEQRLNGTKALAYARYRNYTWGDITRTERQLKLLKAIGQEAIKLSSFDQLDELFRQLAENVQTNMGPAQLYALAKAGVSLDELEMISQTMPGWFLYENGLSYWYVDPKKAKEVATALFKEGKTTVDVVQGTIPQITANKEQLVATDIADNDLTESSEDENNQFKDEVNTQDENNQFKDEVNSQDENNQLKDEVNTQDENNQLKDEVNTQDENNQLKDEVNSQDESNQLKDEVNTQDENNQFKDEVNSQDESNQFKDEVNSQDDINSETETSNNTSENEDELNNSLINDGTQNTESLIIPNPETPDSEPVAPESTESESIEITDPKPDETEESSHAEIIFKVDP